MQCERAPAGREPGPGCSGRRSHDDREYGEPMRIRQLYRYVQEPAANLPITPLVPHDCSHVKVGSQDVDEHARGKRDCEIQAMHTWANWPQLCDGKHERY